MSSLKVLHVGKYYPPFAGGIENFHADLAREQARQGLNVVSLVHNHQRGKKTRQEDVDGTVVHRVQLRARWLYTPICPGFRRELKRILQEFNPDVIHFHLPNPSANIALTLSSACRRPWVAQWQSDIVASSFDRRLVWAYRLYRPVEHRFLMRTSAVIAASPPYLESSDPLKPWQHKCYVVPLGISEERLPAPTSESIRWAERQWCGGQLRVLAIGRLTYYKGYTFLLRAIASTFDTQLCVVGDGDLREPLSAEIDGLQIGDRVRMQGYLSDELVRGLLTTCDCLCLPSIERTEAYGLVMVEAMRYGKPVIASRIPGSGVGWIVEDERTGLLVPPADVAALAAALQRMAGDCQLRQRLGENSACAFKQRFAISPVAEKIQEIYGKVIAQHRA